jgi:hypothetical protein
MIHQHAKRIPATKTDSVAHAPRAEYLSRANRLARRAAKQIAVSNVISPLNRFGRLAESFR